MEKNSKLSKQFLKIDENLTLAPRCSQTPRLNLLLFGFSDVPISGASPREVSAVAQLWDVCGTRLCEMIQVGKIRISPFQASLRDNGLSHSDVEKSVRFLVQFPIECSFQEGSRPTGSRVIAKITKPLAGVVFEFSKCRFLDISNDRAISARNY